MADHPVGVNYFKFYYVSSGMAWLLQGKNVNKVVPDEILENIVTVNPDRTVSISTFSFIKP